MVKHTQSKWEVSSSTLIIAQDKIVANCCFFGIESVELPFKECEANARLIASAPELIYLLKTCLPIIQRHEEYEGLFIAMGKVIAKAEGANEQYLLRKEKNEE